MVTEASGASSSLLTVPISLVRNPVSPRLLSDDSMALLTKLCPETDPAEVAALASTIVSSMRYSYSSGLL